MCISHCMHVAQGTLGIPYENLRNDMSQQLESGVYSVALHLNFRSVLTSSTDTEVDKHAYKRQSVQSSCAMAKI